jgi:uncharacterized membrane protein
MPIPLMLLLIAFQISCSAIGNTIVAQAMRHQPVAKGKVALGTALLACSFGTFALLLRLVPLSVLAPAGAGSYLLVTLLSRFVLKEKVPPLRWAGTALVATGILLVMLSNQPQSLLASGKETRSRVGAGTGAIADDDPASFVTTADGRPAAEDWFAVVVPQRVYARRVVFAHGPLSRNGGWFDASGGKPRVQVRREPDGPWKTVGVLDQYPATTAANPAGIRPGQSFTLRLPEPLPLFAVRVIGKPAGSANPAQAFVSCAGLQAFADP